jgi:serine protease Do
LPLHQLLYEAAQDLSNNDSLFNYLSSLEKEYLKTTLPKEAKISEITPVKFLTQKEMLKYFTNGVVTVQNEEGFGSGILIDQSGYILTNHHVIIRDTANLKVKVFGNEDLLPAEVVAFNSDYDLALIKIEPGKYSCIPVFNTDKPETGDVVYAIGTPLDKTLGQSVTKGIISGIREFNAVSFIQTDVSINSGNSGGALITEEGKFVGMSTMKASGRGIEGLGFCIPSETIINALNLKLKK